MQEPRSDVFLISQKNLKNKKQKYPLGSVGFMCEEQIWV